MLEAETPEETALYRIFGVSDFLLYVGISNDFGRRWKQHAREQPWWDERRRLTVDEWFPFRSEAKAAERAAIKAEHPKYNKVHNVSRLPRRKLVIVQAVPDPLATSAEVAAYLHMSERTLANMRRRDAGPFCRIIGRTPRYHWEDVEEWLAEHPEAKRRAPARPRVRTVQRRVPPAAGYPGVQDSGLPALRALVLNALEDAMTIRGAA
jgi:predicted GIY-YIG superfamily endonuclease